MRSGGREGREWALTAVRDRTLSTCVMSYGVCLGGSHRLWLSSRSNNLLLRRNLRRYHHCRLNWPRRAPRPKPDSPCRFRPLCRRYRRNWLHMRMHEDTLFNLCRRRFPTNSLRLRRRPRSPPSPVELAHLPSSMLHHRWNTEVYHPRDPHKCKAGLCTTPNSLFPLRRRSRSMALHLRRQNRKCFPQHGPPHTKDTHPSIHNHNHLPRNPLRQTISSTHPPRH